ncbi:hypothetical protein AAZX31_05G213200 [Glycine max]
MLLYLGTVLVASYKASAEALVDWTNDIWLVAKTKKVQFETKYMR